MVETVTPEDLAKQLEQEGFKVKLIQEEVKRQ
jgi:hypothetical protein